MVLSSTYSEISEEAYFLHNKLLAEAATTAEIKELYKGCQMLYSPLFHKPKILLMGFNPGGGYYKDHGHIVENFEPMNALDYYLNKHPLGEQTKDLFRLAGCEEDLQLRTVKTNFYYWATDYVIQFSRLVNLLPVALARQVYDQARTWNLRLINDLQPEMVIAEGFQTFAELEVLFPEKRKLVCSDNFKSFDSPCGIKVLGYKRNHGSIVSKKCVSKQITASLVSSRQ